MRRALCHMRGYAHIVTVECRRRRRGDWRGQRKAGDRQECFHLTRHVSSLTIVIIVRRIDPLEKRRERSEMERTRAMKRLSIVCIGALLTLSATPDAFGWGAVSGPRGGAAYRGPMGGAAVRTPSGAAAVRGPYGGTAVRGPAYGGAAYRGPVYGGTVYRPGVGAGVAVGAAAGVAVGAAAGAAAASTYPSCYYPPYYCYPPPYYQQPAW